MKPASLLKFKGGWVAFMENPKKLQDSLHVGHL